MHTCPDIYIYVYVHNYPTTSYIFYISHQIHFEDDSFIDLNAWAKQVVSVHEDSHHLPAPPALAASLRRINRPLPGKDSVYVRDFHGSLTIGSPEKSHWIWVYPQSKLLIKRHTMCSSWQKEKR